MQALTAMDAVRYDEPLRMPDGDLVLALTQCYDEPIRLPDDDCTAPYTFEVVRSIYNNTMMDSTINLEQLNTGLNDTQLASIAIEENKSVEQPPQHSSDSPQNSTR